MGEAVIIVAAVNIAVGRLLKKAGERNE